MSGFCGAGSSAFGLRRRLRRGRHRRQVDRRARLLRGFRSAGFCPAAALAARSLPRHRRRRRNGGARPAVPAGFARCRDTARHLAAGRPAAGAACDGRSSLSAERRTAGRRSAGGASAGRGSRWPPRRRRLGLRRRLAGAGTLHRPLCRRGDIIFAAACSGQRRLALPPPCLPGLAVAECLQPRLPRPSGWPAQPFPVIPALVQISTNFLLSIFSSFANA